MIHHISTMRPYLIFVILGCMLASCLGGNDVQKYYLDQSSFNSSERPDSTGQQNKKNIDDLSSMNLIKSLCHDSEKTKPTLFISGNKKITSSCNRIEDDIKANILQLDSIKIPNGERYSNYEILNIAMSAIFTDAALGLGLWANSMSNTMSDDSEKKPTSFPLAGYAIFGATVAGIVAYYCFDENGYIVYIKE